MSWTATRLRTLTATLLAAAMVLTLGAPAAHANPSEDPAASPRFTDTANSVFRDDIDWLAEQGITKGCNPPKNDRFCPNDYITRGEMAAFLVRLLDLEPVDYTFEDTKGHLFEQEIGALAVRGITRGCYNPQIIESGGTGIKTGIFRSRFCPDDYITRGQMAAFIHRIGDMGGAGDHPLPEYTYPRFTDVCPIGGIFGNDGCGLFDYDISFIAWAGITKGCNPPKNDRFCPDRPITRGEMAAFLRRTWRYYHTGTNAAHKKALMAIAKALNPSVWGMGRPWGVGDPCTAGWETPAYWSDESMGTWDGVVCKRNPKDVSTWDVTMVRVADGRGVVPPEVKNLEGVRDLAFVGGCLTADPETAAWLDERDPYWNTNSDC